jgi:hypothetical protein
MRVIAIASIIVVSNALGLLAAKAVEIVGAGKSFKCTPIAVWDGDGPIWCAEGPRIRISGVAAREMDGTCRANQPCPAVGAIEARDRVVKLFGGATGELNTGHITVKSATMTCISEGGAGGRRTADLPGSFCTKRIDRNWLGKELGHAEEETSAGADCASAAADRGCGVPR